MGRVLSDASSSSADFLFYSGNYCPYCTALKRLLDSKGLTYDEINFNEVDDQVRYDVVQETGHRTVPVVIDNREVTQFLLVDLQRQKGISNEVLSARAGI